MKKILAILFSAHTLLALPVGNPSDPSLICQGAILECLNLNWLRPCQEDFAHLQIGYYGDCVFQRNMETYSLPGWQDQNKDYLSTQIFTNAGYLSVTFCDTAEIFATLGASKISIEGSGGAFKMLSANQFIYDSLLREKGNLIPQSPNIGGLLSIESLSSFCWSIGSKVILASCGPFHVGAEAQYFSSRLPIKYLNYKYLAGGSGLVHANRLLKIAYSEWQIGLGAALSVSCFEPYAAIKVSRANLLMDNAKANAANFPDNFFPILGNSRSSKNWGYAIGNSFKFNRHSVLTLEGRFGDERAVYLNGQLGF
jgi:major outer membrane protein